MKRVCILIIVLSMVVFTHAGQDITSLEMPNGEIIHLGDTRSKLIYSMNKAPYQESYTLVSRVFKRKKIILLKFNLDNHSYVVSLISTKVVKIVKD